MRKRPDSPRGGHFRFRRNVVGVVLARGPLDYDVDVTRRCAFCGNVWDSPLGETTPCPHCSRYPEAAA